MDSNAFDGFCFMYWQDEYLRFGMTRNTAYLARLAPECNTAMSKSRANESLNFGRLMVKLHLALHSHKCSEVDAAAPVIYCLLGLQTSCQHLQDKI
jgi:hypothetical protein